MVVFKGDVQDTARILNFSLRRSRDTSGPRISLDYLDSWWAANYGVVRIILFYCSAYRKLFRKKRKV